MRNDIITLVDAAPKHDFVLMDPSYWYLLVKYTQYQE
jgi:site-specific DNA-adenine methylase